LKARIVERERAEQAAADLRRVLEWHEQKWKAEEARAKRLAKAEWSAGIFGRFVRKIRL